MNSNFFNFKRFGRYFVTDVKTVWSNLWLAFIISSLSAVILYFVVAGFSMLSGNGWTSPPLGARVFMFVLCALLLPITVSISSYGRITDKKAGTTFLLLPVSVFEKYLSMVLVTLIIVPAAFSAIFFSVDYLLCLIDPGCGHSLVQSGIRDLLRRLSEEFNLRGLGNPLLYVDDYWQMILPFLLGSLFFKNNKFIKTVGVWIVVCSAISAIATPILSGIIPSMMENPVRWERIGGWFVDNIALIDCISDTLVNALLLFFIYVRFRTMKH